MTATQALTPEFDIKPLSGLTDKPKTWTQVATLVTEFYGIPDPSSDGLGGV
jgi:hypothetical protein